MSFIFAFPYDLEDFQFDSQAESGNEFLERLRNEVKSQKERYEFDQETVESVFKSIKD